MVFQTKNPNFGNILEDLGMENVVIYSGYLEYFMGILYGHLVILSYGMYVDISPLWYIVPSKSGRPGFKAQLMLSAEVSMTLFPHLTFEYRAPRTKLA
jgi:hypothetical protein